MSHDRRNDAEFPRDAARSGRRYPTGTEQDRFRSGEERRYHADREPQTDREAQGGGAYQGDRRYPASGYDEEFGYRRADQYQAGQYRQDDHYRQELQGERGPGRYGRYPSRAEHDWPHADSAQDERAWRRDYDNELAAWSEREPGSEYYGTGSHYGGGFATAPSSHASSAGSQGARGYAGRGAWSEYPQRQRDPTRQAWEGSRDESFGNQSAHAARRYAEQPYGSGRASYRDRISGYPGRTGLSEASSSFSGRGPKGYQRSDERLKELICEQLTDDPHIDASDIEVQVRQGTVTLTGTVEDRSMKYAAEELVAGCGVQNIENRLRCSR